MPQAHLHQHLAGVWLVELGNVYRPVRPRRDRALAQCRKSLARYPVGFQNSAAVPDLGFYAARSYSLMRPPRTGRRLTASG